MKKQKRFRFLSLMLCFTFLFFAGCEFGGGGNTQSLAGAKVISRPADYSFADAVGDYSENYYNLFAREIMAGLYDVYNKGEGVDFYGNLDAEHGITYTNSDDNNKYYLYDSIRYTITNVKTVKNSDNEIISQTLTIDLSKDWNWNLPYNSSFTTGAIVFLNINSMNLGFSLGIKPENYNSTTTTLEINFDDYFSLEGKTEWQSVYDLERGTNKIIPNYLSVYDSEDGIDTSVDTGDGYNYKEYWFSPYYNEGYTETEKLQNYYQDALEYATYLFVLGYDYDEIEADAPYFEFTPEFDADGSVRDVTVNYGGQEMSVVEALGKVKARYSEVGNYVGLTEKNKKQLAKFIQEKVIGTNSPETFDVTLESYKSSTNDTTGITTEEKVGDDEHLSFNRNYETIVKNIIEYACSKAPIGMDNDGNALTLDQSYPVSQITDYDADNFFLNYNTPDGKNDDHNEYLFQYVDAAEYQSFVLYPLDDQISKDDNLKYIHDLCLAFEYNTEVEGKTMLDALQINVGIRYYSKSAGGYTVTAETSTPISITKGKNTDGVWGDNTCYIGYSEKEQDRYQIATPSDFSFKTDFTRDIGEGAIDPRVDGEAVEGVEGAYRKLITGDQNNRARDYYMLNDSSSYGAYVTLNPEMFAGEDGCDYMEIYFDIVKDKSKTGINYNFKVAIGVFGAYSPEQLGMHN